MGIHRYRGRFWALQHHYAEWPAYWWGYELFVRSRRPREKAETPNAWSVYLKVDDMEQSIEAVKDAGAPVRFATNTADDSKATAGLCDASSFLPEGVPSFWRPYFLVEDADAAIERIKELGGSVIDGSMDSPYGRIATVAGPDAAAFQIVNVPQDS